jgi:hypothetical protein
MATAYHTFVPDRASDIEKVATLSIAVPAERSFGLRRRRLVLLRR